MKAEIDKLIRDNAIPAEIGGRSVLCLNESSIGHLIKDIQKLIKQTNEPEKDKETEEAIDKIILKMNEVWGSDYKVQTDANRKFIRGRLNDGHTVAELILVIESRHKKWSNDPNMSLYLRPSTVFQASKFQGYLNEAKRLIKNNNNMIYVVDSFGHKRRVTKEQFEAAESGFFTKLN
jgi:uncharacterized phage protein (TIGR02220 family)